MVGRPHLLQVGVRPVLADPLSPPPHAERADRDGRAEQRDGQAHRGGDEDRDHRSASASVSSPATREPFTSDHVAGPRVGPDVLERRLGVVVGRDVLGFEPLSQSRRRRSTSPRSPP